MNKFDLKSPAACHAPPRFSQGEHAGNMWTGISMQFDTGLVFKVHMHAPGQKFTWRMRDVHSASKPTTNWNLEVQEEAPPVWVKELACKCTSGETAWGPRAVYGSMRLMLLPLHAQHTP